MRAGAIAAAAPAAAVSRLDAGEAHLWHARASAGLALTAGLLSDEELARAARFRRAEDRDRWLGGRAVLRDLLAAYRIARPREPLTVGRYGKPAAADPGAARFNLSRAGDDVLVAIAWQDVGVDIERSPAGDPVAIARAGLGDVAATRLARLPRDARADELLRLWTRHEARVKAAGTGLAGPPPPSAVTARSLDVGPGRAAAVAAAGPLRVSQLTWQL